MELYCLYMNESSVTRCQTCQTIKLTDNTTPTIENDATLYQGHHESVKSFLTSIDPKCCQLYFNTFINEEYDRIENIKTIDLDGLKEMNIK